MTPERWCEIQRIYHEVRDLAPDLSATRLKQKCDGDKELRLEVESILNHAGGAEDYVNAVVLTVAAEAQGLRQASHETAATWVGPYHLKQKIGEGGMGEVWLAEQNQPVRRRVALKIVKAGMNTPEVIVRFESERQALASMDHLAIAKVFDAGSTPSGNPYFVMEYIAGLPITAYCDHRRFNIRQRLGLLEAVCEGVSHAHQKAIIHRDLKPSNILVAEVDGKAIPKIIDFGVAKALTEKLTADTVFTRLGSPLGTPQYMSPEQAFSSVADIDTRTDVYSLGVLLYVLLTGAPPLDLRKSSFDEFLHRLRDEEPVKPSTKLRTNDCASLEEIAHNRRSEPLALAKEIRGDLDSITLKALEKDRSRRYGSPSDLAADIERYLNNEAVLAVAPSAPYRARKFVGRYRGVLATVGAFVALLLLASGASIWLSVRAAEQRDRADAEAAVAQAVNDFLRNDLLAQASTAVQSGPGVKPDLHMEVRTALDRAAARIAGKFERQPIVEAAIRDTIGQTYVDLGLYAEARPQLERALELERQVWLPENPKTLSTLSRLGRLALLQGNHAQAETIYRQILDIRRRVLGSEHSDTLSSTNDLANVYLAEVKLAQAAATQKHNLDTLRRALGPEHPNTLRSMQSLANIYFWQGMFREAEELHNETLEGRRRVLGLEHPETVASMNNLADDYVMLGMYAQAESLYSQTIEISRRVLGPEHPNTLEYLADFASMYQRQGRFTLAESLLTQILAGLRHVRGSEDPDTMNSAADLAIAYQSQAKFSESEPLAREVWEFYCKKRPNDWERFRAEGLLGMSLTGKNRYAEAELLVLEGYKGMLARKDRITIPDRYYLDLARQSILKFYKARGTPEKAAKFINNIATP